MPVNPQILPNPHLAEYLPDEYVSLGEQEQKAALRAAHLRAANLPEDYDELSPRSQKQARFNTLTSWYDPDKPNVLVTDVDKLIAALYLWVEHYRKGCQSLKHIYFHRDPMHKYDMVRLCMADPVSPSEPAKSVFHAPRGSVKTMTIIQELCAMIAVCRPNTDILISEVNADRSAEELQKIMDGFEKNDVIHADFGGAGVLWPKGNKGALKWNSMQLSFLNGSSIKAYSAKSRQRGRHPLFGVIDDPEELNMVISAELRRKFFDWLFRTWLPMFQAGGKTAWMGTIIDENSCLMIALDGVRKDKPKDTENQIRDNRFDEFNRTVIDLLYTDEDGNMQSRYPDYLNTSGFEAKVRSIGMSAAMAEYRGRPVGSGEFVFHRDDLRHGYMCCLRNPGVVGAQEKYFLDLKTGKQMPWNEWIRTLFIGGASDVAYSMTKDSDYAASTVLAVDPDGIRFVLDGFNKKMLSDDLVMKFIGLLMEWKAARGGIETGAKQGDVYRLARRVCEELQAQGKVTPLISGINNQSNKEQRIICTLRPLFREETIRLPHHSPVTDVRGITHHPVESRNYFIETLKYQIDQYTEEGAGGFDDAIDSLEMAVRVLEKRKGLIMENLDPNAQQLEAWKEVGVAFHPALIPPECWTPEMLRRREEETQAAVGAISDKYEQDPYD